MTFSYAASSALARQMEQGAPADLFASADLDWMDWSQQRNLIRSETRTTLLGNSLVLIEPSERPVTSLQIAPGFPLSAAIGDSRIATGNPASVPVGKYAQQALTTLGVWDQVSPKIAGADKRHSYAVDHDSRRAAMAKMFAFRTDLKVAPSLD